VGFVSHPLLHNLWLPVRREQLLQVLPPQAHQASREQVIREVLQVILVLQGFQAPQASQAPQEMWVQGILVR
jgi:hypothetical protein